MANGRCRNHGGKSLKGKESPTYKHGGRTKEVINLQKEAVQISRETRKLIKTP
jgi:hypothetical protein